MTDLPHNPQQTECTKCVKSKVRCNLDFDKMKAVGIYEGVAVIVLCNKFKER